MIDTIALLHIGNQVTCVPTVLIARTDAYSASLLNSVVDQRDQEFCTGQRSVEGFWEIRGYSNSAEPWFNDRYSTGD